MPPVLPSAEGRWSPVSQGRIAPEVQGAGWTFALASARSHHIHAQEPQDCAWGKWADWSKCTNGVQKRERKIDKPALHGGKVSTRTPVHPRFRRTHAPPAHVRARAPALRWRPGGDAAVRGERGLQDGRVVQVDALLRQGLAGARPRRAWAAATACAPHRRDAQERTREIVSEPLGKGKACSRTQEVCAGAAAARPAVRARRACRCAAACPTSTAASPSGATGASAPRAGASGASAR